MSNNLMDEVTDEFITQFIDFKNRQIITNENLRMHEKGDIHSWLQYLMIKSGEQKGTLTIPEVKIRFDTPMNLRDYGLERKNPTRKFNRVDVAFYNERKNLLGVSEIITMDESHGAIESKMLAKKHNWLTPRDSFPHMVRYGEIKPSFIIMVVILFKRALRITWKTGIEEIDKELGREKNYYRVFKPYWMELSKTLRIDNSLLVISEDGIERVE